MTESQELTLDELIEEFEFLGEWEEQCRYLIEIGEQLPPLPESEMTEANRVRGCQARVWLVPEMRSDRNHVWFHAKSDARLVDGLIVIVGLLFNGKPAQQILATDFREPFKRLGLESHLVPQRRNGLFAMVERVRDIAQAYANSTNADLSAGAQGFVPDAAPASGAPATATANRTPSRTSNASGASAAAPAPSVVTGGQAEALAARTGTQPGFDVSAARAQFPALQHFNSAGRSIVYLDSASSSQKPQSVIDKESEVYQEYYANAYRGVYRFGDRVSRELESVRERVAAFIGAESSEEIMFTSGTTMGMNLIANAWGRKFLRPGDEILLTLAEHHANIVPWQWVAQQTGASVRLAPLTNTGELDLAEFDKLLSSRTRVISVSGLSNVLGTIAPLSELGDRAHQVGAIFVVDGAQSVPHLATNVVAQQIDFLAFSGHKLYGPSGVGACYGRRALLEAMDPFLCGGHMISRVGTDGFETAPIPAKFEAGTLPIAQAIALGPAIDFVDSCGLAAIHAHEQQLLAYAMQQMAKIPGMRMFGPSTVERGGIIPFVLDGASAQDVASLLDVHGVCVRHGHHCTMPLHEWLGEPATVRVSFGLYNTFEDVDALVSGLDAAREILKLT
ncbi:MAG: SufS family cysteine desulfurase [Aureliella sp.]